MSRRTDRSIRLLLTPKETLAMRSILGKKNDRPARMSTARRVLCAIAAAVLSALLALGRSSPNWHRP